MSQIDIESLRALVAVVEQGSFGRGAAGVHRSQSAVTQRIQKLEASLGQPLFERVGRTKRLNESGIRLLDYARRILALHDEACADLAGSRITGEIRLGAPADSSDTILPNLLTRITAKFPGVRPIVHIERSAFLMQAMRRGEIDLAISTLDEDLGPRVILRTVPTVWICAADYQFDRTRPVPLIAHDEPSLFRSIALNALAATKQRVEIPFISPSLSGIRAAVRAGLGITARSVDMLNADFRVLGESEGLPRLPDVNFFLYKANNAHNSIAQAMFDSVAST